MEDNDPRSQQWSGFYPYPISSFSEPGTGPQYEAYEPVEMDAPMQMAYNSHLASGNVSVEPSPDLSAYLELHGYHHPIPTQSCSFQDNICLGQEFYPPDGFHLAFANGYNVSNHGETSIECEGFIVEFASPSRLSAEPTEMSAATDPQSLTNTLGPLLYRAPTSPEDILTPGYSAGNTPKDESKLKDKIRQRNRRGKEGNSWKELRQVVGEELPRYDLLRKAADVLGIPVPPKGQASKRRALMNNIAQTKDEMRKMRKNLSGKEDTMRMSIALDAISMSLEIPKKTPRDEILDKLAAEVRLHKEREEN